jgi:hypothetical protein
MILFCCMIVIFRTIAGKRHGLPTKNRLPRLNFELPEADKVMDMILLLA